MDVDSKYRLEQNLREGLAALYNVPVGHILLADWEQTEPADSLDKHVSVWFRVTPWEPDSGVVGAPI